MIHIATAHHLRPDWIEIQRRYLDRFVSKPFRGYGSLEGIGEEWHAYFDLVVPSKGGHAGKLNLLAQVIAHDADADDQIWFVDGDSFPVADPVGPVDKLLADAALAAIVRLENNGDRQPHPSFCAVPVHVWQSLHGDWSSGHIYAPNRTDVGANLLYTLEQTGTQWASILRSNGDALHPVLFGIYGGFWYHHGAGFRDIMTTRNDPKKALEHDLRGKRMAQHLGQDKLDAMVERAFRNAELSEEIRARIEADPHFYRSLQ